MVLTVNNRTVNSAEVPTGRYTQGGEVDRYKNRLGWWERFPISEQSDDITFLITKKYEFRPDLVAFEMYKKVSLMWLVLQFNNIVDINTEFKAGKQIRLPTPRRVSVSILSHSTGGNNIE